MNNLQIICILFIGLTAIFAFATGHTLNENAKLANAVEIMTDTALTVGADNARQEQTSAILLDNRDPTGELSDCQDAVKMAVDMYNELLKK